jgi:hypothetical protein
MLGAGFELRRDAGRVNLPPAVVTLRSLDIDSGVLRPRATSSLTC